MTFETLRIAFKSTHNSNYFAEVKESQPTLPASQWLCHICKRRMVELPAPRLIVILSLLGLASFSLVCTLTSRWAQFSHFFYLEFQSLGPVFPLLSRIPELGASFLIFLSWIPELGFLPFGTLPASLLVSPINTFQGEQHHFLHEHVIMLNIMLNAVVLIKKRSPICSLSLITGLLASYICCALYLLHTETSSRWSLINISTY